MPEQEKVRYDSASVSKKFASKVLLREKKPTTPFFPTVYETNTFANPYVAIEGLELDDNSDMLIKVTLEGFEYTDPITKYTKEGIEDYNYITLKHPVKVQVTSQAKGVLLEAYVNKSDEFVAVRVKNFKKNEKNAFLREQESKFYKKNMSKINAMLNEELGYMNKSYVASIILPKDKKLDYSEFNEAMDMAMMGYIGLEDNEPEYLLNAIEIWEKALKEADVKNKKARINGKIAAATHCSIAEAYLWLKNYDKAKYHLTKVRILVTKVRILGIGKYEKSAAKIKEFMKDYIYREQVQKVN